MMLCFQSERSEAFQDFLRGIKRRQEELPYKVFTITPRWRQNRRGVFATLDVNLHLPHLWLYLGSPLYAVGLLFHLSAFVVAGWLIMLLGFFWMPTLYYWLFLAGYKKSGCRGKVRLVSKEHFLREAWLKT